MDTVRQLKWKHIEMELCAAVVILDSNGWLSMQQLQLIETSATEKPASNITGHQDRGIHFFFFVLMASESNSAYFTFFLLFIEKVGTTTSNWDTCLFLNLPPHPAQIPHIHLLFFLINRLCNVFVNHMGTRCLTNYQIVLQKSVAVHCNTPLLPFQESF